MAKQADIGFMIWNGKSRGTFNNIVNCIKLNKEVIIYYLTKRKFYHIKTMDDLYKFLDVNVKLNYKLKKTITRKRDNRIYTSLLILVKRTVKGPFNFHIFLYVHIIYIKKRKVHR